MKARRHDGTAHDALRMTDGQKDIEHGRTNAETLVQIQLEKKRFVILIKLKYEK
jgi:hypothetical protein